MREAARLRAAIDILNGLDATALPADRFIARWFAPRRFAGSKDRAAVAERVYRVLRHRASFAWRMGGEDTRALVIASLLADSRTGPEIESLFDGSPHAPAPLDERERRAIATAPAAPPAHVRDEYPEWLAKELQRAFGDSLAGEMQAMLARASVDLRANTLKAPRDNTLAALRSAGFAVDPAPFSPVGLRLASHGGLSALQRTAPYSDGAFEFQDEASQIAALLCLAEPGMRVLDFAAGSGGKALALAACMKNDGEIVASDIDAKRLDRIGDRTLRAGVTIIRTCPADGVPPEPFDVVLLDAPCSGSGTWRRSPELKWRLTASRLAELIANQSDMLDRCATHVRSGGRLVYATCSLLPSENEDQVASFLSRWPDFRVLDAVTVWAGLELPHPPGLGRYFHASPAKTGTDGFFTAILIRV